MFKKIISLIFFERKVKEKLLDYQKYRSVKCFWRDFFCGNWIQLVQFKFADETLIRFERIFCEFFLSFITAVIQLPWWIFYFLQHFFIWANSIMEYPSTLVNIRLQNKILFYLESAQDEEDNALQRLFCFYLNVMITMVMKR